MTLLEQIQDQLRRLPPEKQREVYDFVEFLRHRLTHASSTPKTRSLRDHPAFGLWRGRNIDALNYQLTLRAEWDGRV